MLRVVIVNYRTPELAIDCIASLMQDLRPSPVGVTVVDNASGDHSVEMLGPAAKRCEGAMQVIPAPRNGGFAYGNNIGIRAALDDPATRYVLLLNPDTIVRVGALQALLEFMEAHPRAGIAGSALENAAGERDLSAHNTPSPLGELEGSARSGVLTRLLRRYAVSAPVEDRQQRCEWVSGASFLIRREVIESIGLLDEGYFLYYEEVDYCLRAREAGWEVWYVPESRVMHLEGASTGIQHTARRRPVYWYASRRRFFAKHYGLAGLAAADVLWAVGHASLRLRLALGLKRGAFPPDPPGMAADLLWGDLKAFLQGRVLSHSPAHASSG
jgi:hypothetical protein